MSEIVDEFSTVVPAAAADTAVGSKNRNLFGKYELGKILGCGAFAKVYHARDVGTGQSVAIKAISRNKVLKEGQAANVKREMSIMRRLRHPHIVRLFEVLATKTKIYFVIEFAKGGELFAKVAKGRFSEDLSRRYFQQLVSAVGFCHSRGVFHRDLKPENLLLDENWDLKVTDFGLSAVADQIRADGLLHTLCGTPAYVAPEVLAKKGYDGAKVDVWSCGIILYVLTAGYLPFNDPNLMVMYRKIYRGEFRCPKWMSPDLKRFLSRLLDTNPDTRIKVDEIISDPWFKKDYKETKSSSEGLVLKERGESEQFLNAFDIISFSPSLDMSGLVAIAGGPTKCERFLTEVPPEEVIGRIEAAAKGERLTVVKKKDWGLKVEGRNGNFDMVLEIDRLTEKLVVVEIYRREIGSGSGHGIWNDKLRPQLSSLIYQPERRVASG